MISPDCKQFWRTAFVMSAVFLAAQTLPGQDQVPPGTPPQFLTPPLHAPEQVAQAVGGHLVYTPVSAAGNSTSSSSVIAIGAAVSSVTLTVGLNVDVSQALDSYQGEPMLATNSNGLLVGGYNSIYPGNCSASLANCAPGSAASSSGSAWTNARMPLMINSHAFLIGYDPSLASDVSHTFYYLYGVSDGGTGGANGIAIASSANGVTWTLKTPVTFNNGGQFDDKPWIAAHPSQTGHLVAGWDRNKGNDQTLFAAVSLNGGTTWSGPFKVNDGTSKFERVIYAFPAFDPSDASGNRVYMAWLDYARNIIFVDKSVDGGFTWGTDVPAAATHVGFGTDIGCNGGRSMTPAPQMGIDSSGNVYLTYADQLAGGRTGSYDIFFVKSTDGGTHWSVPVRLNDDKTSTHQYNPALSVLPNGTLNVSWYDRRNDPTNNCATDVYAAVSTDGGATFSANTRVTPVSSDYDGNPNGPGDYSGNAPFGFSTILSFPFFCSHLATDIAKETGTAGAFEIYTAPVSH
jgi:hypothetical protein